MIRAEPLRSPSQLPGVSGLKDLDSKRVAAANNLYALTLCLICILVCRGASVSVKNHRNSYLWAIMQMWARQHPRMQQVWESLRDDKSQACMYGNKMDKWTTIKATASLYDAICKQCDGSHTHDSWKPSMGPNGPKFPKTGQSEYPVELVQRDGKLLSEILGQQGDKISSQTCPHRRHWHRDSCVFMDENNSLHCWPSILDGL